MFNDRCINKEIRLCIHSKYLDTVRNDKIFKFSCNLDETGGYVTWNKDLRLSNIGGQAEKGTKRWTGSNIRTVLGYFGSGEVKLLL